MSPEEARAFVARVRDNVPELFAPHHRYHLSPKRVPFKEVKTAVGESVFRSMEIVGSQEAHLLFVDAAPAANWAHRCYYVFIRPEGGFPLIIRAEWPPSEEVELVEVLFP